MRSAFIRLLAASVVGLGLLLAWSSHMPIVDLDSWREQQLASALEEAQADVLPPAEEQVAPEPTAVPIPKSPESPASPPTSTPVPLSNEAIAIDCDAASEGVQASCTYESGALFSIELHVTSAPESGYSGFESRIAWEDATLE